MVERLSRWDIFDVAVVAVVVVDTDDFFVLRSSMIFLVLIYVYKHDLRLFESVESYACLKHLS